MSFKDKLKEVRVSKNLSRRILSRLSGVSPNSIEKYERGIRKLRLENSIKLSKALEVNPRITLESFSRYEGLIDAILEMESSN